jgi:hypothetical protein
MAEIIRIDYDRMVCDLKYLEGGQPYAREVPLSSAYWSRRGFIGAMPAEGSIVIVGNYAAQGHHATLPLILAYMPSGYRTGIRYDPIGSADRGTEDIAGVDRDVLTSSLEGIYGPTRHKFLQLYPGDVYVSSDHGGQALITADVVLRDMAGQSFGLSADHETAILRAYHTAQKGPWGQTLSGRVIRNGLLFPAFLQNPVPPEEPLYDILLEQELILPDGSWAPDINTRPIRTLADGSAQGQDHHTEDRLELYLTEQEGGLGVEDLAWPVITQTTSPFIERVLGSYIGNDLTTLEGRKQYGRLLRPRIFTSKSAIDARPGFEEINEDEESLTAAFVHRMRRPDGLGELIVAHDRDGKAFVHLPASSAKVSNTGAGSSLDLSTDGAVKAVIGSDLTEGLSIDLTTTGGMTSNLGAASESNLSMDLFARGAIRVETTRADDRGIGFEGIFQGTVRLDANGDLNFQSTGSAAISSAGVLTLAANGIVEQAGITGVTRVSQGPSLESVTSRKEYVIQGGRLTTINTPREGSSNADELTILTGNKQTTFVAPAVDQTTFQSAGTHRVQSVGTLTYEVTSLSTGQFVFSAPSGAWSSQIGINSVHLDATRFHAEVPRVDLGFGASLPVALAPGVNSALDLVINSINTQLTLIAASISAGTTGGPPILPYVPIPLINPPALTYASTITFTL